MRARARALSRAHARVQIFAYYTAILGAIYNMRRTKKAKGQMVRKRRMEEERGEREMRARRRRESMRLHRSRSTVCKPSSIIKFLLARARAWSVRARLCACTRTRVYIYVCIHQGGSVFIQNTRIVQKLVYHSRIKVRLLLRVVPVYARSLIVGPV